jgi:hypothetical protein
MKEMDIFASELKWIGQWRSTKIHLTQLFFIIHINLSSKSITVFRVCSSSSTCSSFLLKTGVTMGWLFTEHSRYRHICPSSSELINLWMNSSQADSQKILHLTFLKFSNICKNQNLLDRELRSRPKVFTIQNLMMTLDLSWKYLKKRVQSIPLSKRKKTITNRSHDSSDSSSIGITLKWRQKEA